jgi:hypothetical protein
MGAGPLCFRGRPGGGGVMLCRGKNRDRRIRRSPTTAASDTRDACCRRGSRRQATVLNADPTGRHSLFMGGELGYPLTRARNLTRTAGLVR